MQKADLKTSLRKVKRRQRTHAASGGESLDTKWYLQTPDIAFWARLPEGCKVGMFLNRMETDLNGGQRIY